MRVKIEIEIDYIDKEKDGVLYETERVNRLVKVNGEEYYKDSIKGELYPRILKDGNDPIRQFELFLLGLEESTGRLIPVDEKAIEETVQESKNTMTPPDMEE